MIALSEVPRIARPGAAVTIGGAKLRIWLETHERDREGSICHVHCVASERATTRVRISAKSAAEFLRIDDADAAGWLATVELYSMAR